ncbi:hypothetical protein AVEN_160937-1 [Araneus ventricosus]|uniref:Uncharacterized protein n=1 Tax=Araneus ventricosus TaxID=182803 RepID=A0A4Y2JRF7_ARAVE|nr:hypothetical protein AVEN_160937-1 [Araneus ventricosus]
MILTSNQTAAFEAPGFYLTAHDAETGLFFHNALPSEDAHRHSPTRPGGPAWTRDFRQRPQHLHVQLRIGWRRTPRKKTRRIVIRD